MHSYDSPGRIVTIINGGAGATDVRGDQPYRLRSYSGVTQSAAAIGEEVNLVTEGVFMQRVALATGVSSARAGDLVHVSTADWSLVAGLGSAGAPGFEPFGQLADFLTGSDLVRVKLLPTQVTGGVAGGGGATAPASRYEVGDIALLTAKHDKTKWKAANGQIIANAGNPALAAFLSGYAPQATNWATGAPQVSFGQLNGALTFFKGIFVIGAGLSANVTTTPTGATLTQRATQNGNRAFATDGAMLMGYANGTVANRSADGIAWTSQALTWTGGALSGSAAINAAAFAGGRWVVVGNSAVAGDYDLIGSSIDGITFTRRQCALEMQLWSVAYSQTLGLWAACGDNGGIVTSPDAETWTVRTSRTSQTLRSIIWDGTRFVAVGVGGRMVVSGDGITWDPYVLDAAMNDLSSIVYAAGVYVVVGSSSALEGRSRIKVGTELFGMVDRILDGNGSRAAYTPYRVAWGGDRFLMTFNAYTSSTYDFVATSTAPEVNPATQSVIPNLPAPSPEASFWMRAVA